MGELFAESGFIPDPLNLFVNTSVGSCLFNMRSPISSLFEGEIFLWGEI